MALAGESVQVGSGRFNELRAAARLVDSEGSPIFDQAWLAQSCGIGFGPAGLLFRATRRLCAQNVFRNDESTLYDHESSRFRLSGRDMPRINSPIRFDAGIEQILIQSDPRPSTLPDGSRPVPGEGQITRLLDEVLSPPSVEQALVESLRPEIGNREMLSPSGYQAARDFCVADLQRSLSSATTQEERGAIERAIHLLSDDNSLRELLDRYRSVLHRA
jgi:hypothetical protein